MKQIITLSVITITCFYCNSNINKLLKIVSKERHISVFLMLLFVWSKLNYKNLTCEIIDFYYLANRKSRTYIINSITSNLNSTNHSYKSPAFF